MYLQSNHSTLGRAGGVAFGICLAFWLQQVFNVDVVIVINILQLLKDWLKLLVKVLTVLAIAIVIADIFDSNQFGIDFIQNVWDNKWIGDCYDTARIVL